MSNTTEDKSPYLKEIITWMRQQAMQNISQAENNIEEQYYEGYLAALNELSKEMELSPFPVTSTQEDKEECTCLYGPSDSNPHCKYPNCFKPEQTSAPKVDREKERAIAFAKWVLKGGWEIPNSNHEYQDLWTDQGHRWPVELKTSDELYDLFLQSQNK